MTTFAHFAYSPPTASSHHQFVLLSEFEFLFFFFCLILFCQIPHISEIIQFLSFSFWFISLSVMLSNSTHVVINGRISSFFMSKWYLCVCLCETYLTNIYKCNMYLARFLHPFFSHWWTQIFFSPCLTYHKQCGNEHTGANIFAI